MANKDKSLNITGDVFQSLQIKCVQAGTNLSDVCKEAGVHRSVVERWKADEPKTIQILRKMHEVLDRRLASRN